MQLKILSDKFYDTYSHCNEILEKKNRPSIESREFAIIKREEQKIRYGLVKYVNQYKHSFKTSYRYEVLNECCPYGAVSSILSVNDNILTHLL